MPRIRQVLATGLVASALISGLAVDYELVPEPGSLLLVGTVLILGARRARRVRQSLEVP
jgi:hypothetical protein